VGGSATRKQSKLPYSRLGKVAFSPCVKESSWNAKFPVTNRRFTRQSMKTEPSGVGWQELRTGAFCVTVLAAH
jgi:hypothetical protein